MDKIDWQLSRCVTFQVPRGWFPRHNLSRLKGIGELHFLSRLQKQSTLAKPRDGNVPLENHHEKYSARLLHLCHCFGLPCTRARRHDSPEGRKCDSWPDRWF